MEEITSILFSWQFLMIGVLVAVFISSIMKIGSMLWKINSKFLRQVIIFLDGISPCLPPIFGAAIGAIPLLPRPEVLQGLPDSQSYIAMIFVGLLAGVFYERIWKSVKQIMEARGLSPTASVPPKDQKKYLKAIDKVR